MAIPKYDEITLPLLRILSDGIEFHRQELPTLVADHFQLTDEERNRKLPSGQSTYLKNRTGWAGFHLRKAGLVESPRESVQRITEAGRKFLTTNPPKITRAVLMQFEPFKRYMEQVNKDASAAAEEGPTSASGKQEEEDETTPEERIESSYALLRAQLASDLLVRIKEASPVFFEQLVVDLLLKMGYGGSRAEAGRATKPTGDNGIDGVIDEDRLGLDTVYVQAKRWENSVWGTAATGLCGRVARSPGAQRSLHDHERV